MPSRKEQQSIDRFISVLYRLGQSEIGKELESFGIGRGQHSFLAALYQRDGIPQGDLVRILQMDKGAVAHALAKLEDAKYVERRRDEVDKRVVRVYLTQKARSFERRLAAVLAAWTATLTEGLTADEREQLLALLERMANNATRASESEKDWWPGYRL